MTRLLVIVVAAGVLLAAAATADAAPTRARLQSAMQAFAVCHAQKGATVVGGTSSAYRGRVTFQIWTSNHAALVVYAGPNQRHRILWISSTGVVTHLGSFGLLSNVAAKLRAAC